VTLRRAEGDDEVLVTVPAGVRSGTRLRLRGKGRSLGGGGRGDAYLIVEVEGAGP
jgi:curved DNA-binding protein